VRRRRAGVDDNSNGGTIMMATASSPSVHAEPRGRSRRAEHWSAGARDAADLDRHVHLVVLGLPGAGTSTVGRLVAHQLQRPYVDHDSIVALGRDDDPPDARVVDEPDADVAAVRRVLGTHASVVYGVGGHVVERLAPADLDDAYIVWLDATPEVVAGRIGEREHPALGPEPLPTLRALADRLDPVVADLCDLRVDIDHTEPEVAADQILCAWRHHVDEVESQHDARQVS
jgi:shikimate kinase